ncbi:DgyrCDS3742 [Dimorphilus gyrociliatus]|uniref:DgyrCDS3742 n=1 Tax=Dimorphilus gyrociliatus TaxID=2664684 RepID=A0A7I8VHG0_9ANNE|nr:DgyrCDS3742 [Dimorphilus gyrociliatus]
MSSSISGEVSNSAGKVCKFYTRKKGCKLGDSCKFLHSEEKTNHAILSKENATPSERKTNIDFNLPESETRKDDSLNKNAEDFKKEVAEGEKVFNKPCYKFTKSGTCPFGDNCKYQHVLKETKKKQFRKKVSKYVEKNQEVSNRPLPCKFFLSGHCKLGKECQFWHPTTEEAYFMKEKSKARKFPPKLVVEKPKYRIDDLTQEKQEELRNTEIDLMKKKYPQCYKLEMKLETYVLEFIASDPDWTFDVKEVHLMIGFPSKYPIRSLRVKVHREQSERLPEPLCDEVDKALASWLDTKSKHMEISGSVELMLRPLLKWFDKQMEDLFVNGLKQYQRKLIAQQAGLQFVSHSEIFKKEEDWVDPDDNNQEASDFEEDDGSEGNYEDDKSGSNFEEDDGETEDSTSCEEDEKPKRPYAPGSMNHPLDEARKGTEIRFKDLQLREQSGTLEIVTLKVQIACSRCRNIADIKVPRKKVVSLICMKCSNEMSVHYRPAIAHTFSSVVGYLDLEECSPFDLILIDTEFKVNCLNCHNDMNLNGIHTGQMKNGWCKHCHKKLHFAVDSIRFTQLTADGIPLGASIYKLKDNRKRVPKDPLIREGYPLPDNGACKHYKKSFRWFRFPCCGKAYPCDTCHDEKEDHMMTLANRMICGFCCKEQQFAAEKSCIACDKSLTKKCGSHWEGGKGCRDKSKMSKNDSQKYANLSKTTSRKKQAKKN